MYRLAHSYREVDILAQEPVLGKSLCWREKALASFRLMSRDVFIAPFSLNQRPLAGERVSGTQFAVVETE